MNFENANAQIEGAKERIDNTIKGRLFLREIKVLLLIYSSLYVKDIAINTLRAETIFSDYLFKMSSSSSSSSVASHSSTLAHTNHSLFLFLKTSVSNCSVEKAEHYKGRLNALGVYTLDALRSRVKKDDNFLHSIFMKNAVIERMIEGLKYEEEIDKQACSINKMEAAERKGNYKTKVIPKDTGHAIRQLAKEGKNYEKLFSVVFKYQHLPVLSESSPYANGNTALHECAWRGWNEGLELLVNFGAAINKKNAFGRTPLHHAAINCR